MSHDTQAHDHTLFLGYRAFVTKLFLQVLGDLFMNEHGICPGPLFLVSSLEHTAMAQGEICSDLSRTRCSNMFPVLDYTCEVPNTLA